MQYANTWPLSESGYELEAPIGYGSFGTVYAAAALEGPNAGEKVAIKVIELENYPDSNIEEIRKEIQIMRLSSHQNVLSYHVCFLSGRQLWMVMPLLEGGSVGNLLKHRYQEGIKDQVLLASILREVLEGIYYFHQNNQIHRDIKAGNILVSRSGQILLGDFGVAAKLRQGMSAKTFAGSPCWMAPEVVESGGTVAYTNKIDIWSFGITAIELAKGRPPYAGHPAMKVMLMIISNDPPSLDEDEEFDASFKEMINLCLQKEPELRPTAESLLRKKFFNKAKGVEYIRTHMCADLPRLDTLVKLPKDRKVDRDQSLGNMSSGSGGWDFSVSTGENPLSGRRANDDPLEQIGSDEEDPLDSLQEEEN